MKKDFGYREIPYNYTSFSDKEIILKYFDDATWELLNDLRHQRKTGRSARLIFEIIGDIFIIDNVGEIHYISIDKQKFYELVDDTINTTDETKPKFKVGDEITYKSRKDLYVASSLTPSLT